jgi:hypothetical protein
MIDILFCGVLLMAFVGTCIKDHIHYYVRSNRVRPIDTDEITCSVMSLDEASH